MFSFKFAAYFQNTFSLEHLWVAASEYSKIAMYFREFFENYKAVHVSDYFSIFFLLLLNITYLLFCIIFIYGSIIIMLRYCKIVEKKEQAHIKNFCKNSFRPAKVW